MAANAKKRPGNAGETILDKFGFGWFEEERGRKSGVDDLEGKWKYCQVVSVLLVLCFAWHGP